MGEGEESVMLFSFLTPGRKNQPTNKQKGSESVKHTKPTVQKTATRKTWILYVICSILSEKEAFLKQCSLSGRLPSFPCSGQRSLYYNNQRTFTEYHRHSQK